MDKVNIYFIKNKQKFLNQMHYSRYHGGEISLSVDTGTVLKHSLTQHGSVLTLHSVTRGASGVYICTATNGVGQPATSQVNRESSVKNLGINTKIEKSSSYF